MADSQILRKIGFADLFVDIIGPTVIPRRDGGPSTRSRTNIRAILGNKWHQARLAPLLFTLVCSAMLNDTFRDNDLGALIRFRTDGNSFNLP